MADMETVKDRMMPAVIAHFYGQALSEAGVIAATDWNVTSGRALASGAAPA